mgnify:CR=1 FL=1|jgi:hypothetical protein
MHCSNCGTKIEDEASFCQSCGKPTSENKATEGKEDNVSELGLKNYSPVFWKYFWIGVLLNVFSRGVESAGGEGLWIIFFILAGIYIYKFSATINEAMLSIGKKNWWPLGLLSIIPFGFWIAFLVVRAKLKPHGKWVSGHKSFKMSKKI